jgi:hypothetical protein
MRPTATPAATVLPLARPVGPIPTVLPTGAFDPAVVPTVGPRPGLTRRTLRHVGSVSEWLFGALTLVVGLSLLAAVPLGQFLTLGYLLESSGRVARTGRLRDGFIGVRRAARVGGVALGVGLMWLPLWAVSSFADSARIIDPGGRYARQFDAWLWVLAVAFALHVGAACLRGGRLRYFVWPFNLVWLARRAWRGGLYQEARDRLWDAVTGLRLPYYFWLGARGFVGGLLWLAVPLALLGLGHKAPAVGLLGAVLLAAVVLYVPFLQTRFARDGRLRAFIQLGAVRRDFRKAPLAFAAALVVLLVAAMPLYLLKIELIPRDLIFLEGLVFLAFIFPARLLVGWAYGRAGRRDRPRHWILRWSARLLVIPVVAAYVVVVFGSQHLGWRGIPSLYEQHAFLLPVPFAG